MSLARELNVTSVSCKKQQKDSDKWQIFIGIKVSPFAGKTFSNENIFAIFRFFLVPQSFLWRNFQIHVQKKMSALKLRNVFRHNVLCNKYIKWNQLEFIFWYLYQKIKIIYKKFYYKKT